MVKRVLSICLIVITGMTSLVASCLHQSKQSKPYVMYQESRQLKNEVYHNAVELQFSDLVPRSKEIHIEDNAMKTSIVSDVAVAGVFVANLNRVKKDIQKIKYLYEVTKEERKMLERITEAECTGADIDSKKNIVSNILNRVESNSFPSSIEKVIFQKTEGNYQFSPIADNRYYEVLVTEETKQAVEDVLLDGVTHECLYFFNTNDVKSPKIKKWINKKLKFVFKDTSGHSHYNEK